MGHSACCRCDVYSIIGFRLHLCSALHKVVFSTPSLCDALILQYCTYRVDLRLVLLFGRFFKSREVVRDFKLSLGAGEVVGLLGPNGAGKTTCFYMIVGLVPTDAASRFQLEGTPPWTIGYALSLISD